MDVVRQVYREMWKIVLDGSSRRINPDDVTHKIRHFFDTNGLPLYLEAERRAFSDIAGLARQGIEISKRLVQWSKDIERHMAVIKSTGPVIQALDEQIEIHGMAHQACYPLAHMFRQGKENLEEADLGLLSTRTLTLYRTLFREATLMKRGLEDTVAALKVK